MQRSRTDERFRKGLAELEREAAARRRERYERLRGTVRDDLPIEAIARFLSALANGLALARVSGDELGDLDTLFELSATGVAPRGAA